VCVRQTHFLLAGLLILLSPIRAQQKGAEPQQTQFTAEDHDVKRPVAIPSEVMDILSKDERVRNALEYEHLDPKQLPKSWFSASATHLGPSSRSDLIVEAQDGLRGANVIMLWVFCATESGFRLVLAAPAHDLEILRTRWNGYRELELSAETPVTFTAAWFRWNGSAYVKFHEKSSDI
jgi:hypothetical protein